MLRSRRAWIVAGLGAARLAFPAPALADEPSDPRVESIAITYAATASSCPSESRFTALVRKYTDRWSLAEPGANVRTFRVELAARDDAFAGTLAITSGDGKTSSRELVAPGCDALARGLAIFTALAIDPQAHIEEPHAEAPEPETTPKPSSPPVRSPGPPPAPPLTTRAPPRRRPLSLRFSVEGRAELTSAVTTGVLPVFGAAVAVRMAPGDALPEWLSPSLAVGLRQSLPKEEHVASGTSRFLWTAATIRFCPVRFVALSSRLDVTPCAEVDWGVLDAEARGIPGARSDVSTWFDRGLSVRSAYQVLPPLAIGAGVLVTAPVSRHRFALSSGELISQAPPVGITGGLLVEWRL